MTAVGGSWKVPAVPSSSHRTAALTAITLDGGSTTLLAVGTEEATTGTGTTYRALYELGSTTPVFLTAASTTGGAPVDTVAPGDTLTASITNAGPTEWKLVVTDGTRWTFSTTVTYKLSASGAGWGTSRTYVKAGSTLTPLTLADFGTTTFSHLTTATSGATPAAPAATSATTWYMYDTTSGDFLSVAGPVVATTGDSFTDHFVSVPQRISGSTADATAVQELEHQFPTGSCPGTTGTRPVVLATHKSYPDALSSAYLASSLGTGTLLTASTSLSAATLGALKQEGITNVVVVGGSLAVTATVVNQLEATPAYSCGGGNKLGKNLTVRRIAGPTAYDTALDIATAPTKTYVGKVDLAGAYGVNTQGDAGIYNTTKGNASPAALSPTAVPTAILATTHTFQDAMSASTVAYADHLPILLTTTSKLSSQVSSAISQLGIQQVIVMGGPFAVSDAVVTALEGEHVSVLRIAGTDYTDTAVELALCELGPATGHVGLGWPSTGGVFVARGSGFTDGLAGAVVTAGGPAGASPSPLLLTENATTPGTYLLGFLAVAGTGGVATKPLTHLVVLGGPLAVSEHSANLMEVALDL